MTSLDELLKASATHHSELCPRQVLGVRMALLAGELLNLDVPRKDKRLLALVETDGCAADGIAAGSGCYVGRRTMRVIDFGKVAATFVDTETEQAVRIVPQASSRERARAYAADEPVRWKAQLRGYQMMPAEDLLAATRVTLTLSLRRLISKDGCRVLCQMCHEEIINEREVHVGGLVLCRACAGDAYYQAAQPDTAAGYRNPHGHVFRRECTGQRSGIWGGSLEGGSDMKSRDANSSIGARCGCAGGDGCNHCCPAGSCPAGAACGSRCVDLRPAFDEIGALFAKSTGRQVDFVYGSSGMLSQQVGAGAPYDVFASADPAYIDACRRRAASSLRRGTSLPWDASSWPSRRIARCMWNASRTSCSRPCARSA